MRAEAGNDLLDGAVHLLLVGNVGGIAVHLRGDSDRWRRQLAIDNGDSLDHFFFEQRIDDTESESARSTSDDCVFHDFSPPWLTPPLCGCLSIPFYRRAGAPRTPT